VPNPRVACGFLSANPWATLTGGQRDDDHDGYGNVCDGKFVDQGTVVGPGDTAQYKASVGRDRRTNTCGTSGTLPCAIFDLNLDQNDDGITTIGPEDTARYKLLVGSEPGPKCDLCTGSGAASPLGCKAGANASCE